MQRVQAAVQPAPASQAMRLARAECWQRGAAVRLELQLVAAALPAREELQLGAAAHLVWGALRQVAGALPEHR